MNSVLRLFRSRTVRGVLAAGGAVAAVFGFVSDVLGIRESQEVAPVAVTVEVTAAPVSTTSSSTTVATPTTLQDLDPESALEELRISLAARSSSGVLDGCGLHAMLLTSTGLKFFEWTDDRWSDFSAIVDSVTSARQTGLQVVDIPADGNPDVLVTFDRVGAIPPSGGIWGLPPGVSVSCDPGAGFNWRYLGASDGSYGRLAPNLAIDGGARLTTRGPDDSTASELTWDDRNSVYVPIRPVLPTEIASSASVQTDVAARFMSSYAQFTTASFVAMLGEVTPGSPAESLVQFLLIGKRIQLDAGYGEGSGFPLIAEGQGYRIMFPGGGTRFDAFAGADGRISTFLMNGIPLDRLIRLDRSSPAAARACTTSGVCIGIRGVQLGIRTTYMALEVDASQTSRQVKFVEASLTTGSVRNMHVGASTPAPRRRPNAEWSLAFPLSELPWGGTLEVVVAVGGDSERVSVVVP